MLARYAQLLLLHTLQPLCLPWHFPLQPQISTLMDKFEEQFSDMDVRAGYMENAMGNATSTATPEHEVDALLQQVGDEHDLEVGDMLADVPADAIGAPAAAVSTGAGASPVAVGAGGAGTDRHHRGGGGGGGGSGGAGGGAGAGGGGGGTSDLEARLAALKK